MRGEEDFDRRFGSVNFRNVNCSESSALISRLRVDVGPIVCPYRVLQNSVWLLSSGDVWGVVAESVAFSLAIQSLIDLGSALTELRLEIRLTRMRNFSLGNDIDSTGSLICG